MAEVKWIKICTEIFDDESIKLIEEMPEGDAIIVIWFKLLIQAGKNNDCGIIYFKKDIPYTDEMLATVFKRPLNVIRMAINVFRQFGMIEILDTQGILISNWEKHQNIEGLDKIREQNRIRKQKERSNKKLLTDCHVTVTPSHAIDIDKEEDIEIDILEEESAEQFLELTKNFHGEYSNVFLDDQNKGRLMALVLSEKVIETLINDLSVNIEKGKVPRYEENLPNAHFEVLKSYWNYRRKNPAKFKTQKQENKQDEASGDDFYEGLSK